MNCFPSPPSSPYLSYNHQEEEDDNVTCGACNKILGSDWFCSDCHRKCSSCNRFLSQDEYCSRCWSFDPVQQQYTRKSTFINHIYQYRPTTTTTIYSFHGLPTPSNSTENSTLYHNK